MAKTKISEFSATPANNTDIDSINIAEGCSPSGINDAIRELMAQLKDFQTGAVGDSFNGPVGTTTAAAGAFTTLAASGAVTLSGGTANGVVYLNGSKVVTSGSALTFSGQQFAISSLGDQIKISNSVGNQLLTLSSNSAGSVFTSHDGTSFVPILWQSNTAELMRLTSTGLGIGTSSPATKLQVYGGALTVGNESTYAARFGNNSNKGVTIGYDTTNNVGHIGSINPAVAWTDLVINANGGNLGLGVTPSAWSTGKAIEVGRVGNAIWNLDSNETYFLSNAYFNSGFKYGANGTATQYLQFSGQHRWYNAPSGTAGNAITFTQVMTLDASGNLLVGSTSSPSTVWSGSRTFSYVKGNTAGNGGEVIVESNNGNQQASFFASAITAEFGLWSTKASALLFGTNNTERARIDSSGNILLGTTSAFSNAFTSVYYVPGTTYGIGFKPSTNSNTPKPCSFLEAGGAEVGSITTSGSATLYNITSDQRLKENIVNAPEFGSVIDSLQVRSFDWKTDQTHQRAGFIAQELVTVAPEAVYQPEDTEQMMAVDYSKLVPMLVKEIQSLRVRVAQLESN